MPGKGQYKPAVTFDTIDCEEKAYILGFITADAYVGPGAVEITLKAADVDLLHEFKAFFGRGKLVEKTASNQAGIFRCRYYYSSMPCVQSLAKLGLRSPRKDPPFQWLEEPYLKHYVRGLVDGDGWVKTQRGLLYVGYTGTPKLVKGVAQYWESILGYSPKIRPNGSIWSITITRAQMAHKLLSWLYSDATLYLHRKHETFLSGRTDLKHRPRTSIICQQCDDPFEVYWHERNQRKYCSRKCYYASRRL